MLQAGIAAGQGNDNGVTAACPTAAEQTAGGASHTSSPPAYIWTTPEGVNMRMPMSPELDSLLPPLTPTATPTPAEGSPEQAIAAMAAAPVINMGPPVGPRGVKRSREDAMQQVLTTGCRVCSSSVCMLGCTSMQYQCALILYAPFQHTVITASSHVSHHQQKES